MIGSARIARIVEGKCSQASTTTKPKADDKEVFIAVELVHVPYHVEFRFARKWWMRVGESRIRSLPDATIAVISVQTLVAYPKKAFPAAKLHLTKPIN